MKYYTCLLEHMETIPDRHQAEENVPKIQFILCISKEMKSQNLTRPPSLHPLPQPPAKNPL